jgi:predicted nucleic acid-binding Zn ribbon protein
MRQYAGQGRVARPAGARMKHSMHPSRCAVCGEGFFPVRPSHKTCSKKCYRLNKGLELSRDIAPQDKFLCHEGIPVWFGFLNKVAMEFWAREPAGCLSVLDCEAAWTTALRAHKEDRKSWA